MITIFIPGTPKNSNASGQWARMATAANRKKFRRLAAETASNWRWPNGAVPDFVRVTARQISTVNRRRDPGGLAERLKPLLDGLVDAGLLEDDNEDRIQLVLEHSEVRKSHPHGIELTLEPACPPSSNESSSASPVTAAESTTPSN